MYDIVTLTFLKLVLGRLALVDFLSSPTGLKQFQAPV